MKERGEAMASSFKDKQRYLYYQLEAAQIEKNICTMVQKGQIPERHLRPHYQLEAARIEKNISPMGENEEIPERHLRPLTKLDPEQQKEARHSILCLLSRWQGRIKKSETGKS